MRYDVIEKIGEGNRGEVYKIRLENGKIAALKWSKNYNIDKEWEILNYLNGKIAPKPYFRGKRFFVFEYIEGKPLKNFINTPKYYEILKDALIKAYELDNLKIFHKQLGRYYHIIYTKDGIRFLDFERAVITDKPRNFLQILGYYLNKDENFNKDIFNEIVLTYKDNPQKALEIATSALEKILK